MASYLTLKIPGIDGGTQELQAPKAVPTGGLEPGGTGEKIIQNSILYLLTAIAVLSVVFLIWGGIKWITAAGDKTKIDSARRTILYAIIGLVLSFLSFMIVAFVGNYFEITFF